jgi:hypothetical protein
MELNEEVKHLLMCGAGNRMRASWCKVKVKCTLEQATRAQRGSMGIDLLFL